MAWEDSSVFDARSFSLSHHRLADIKAIKFNLYVQKKKMLVESHPGHPIIELTLKSISQATLFFTLSVVDDFAGDVAYSELKQTFACSWVGEQGIERLYVRSDELFQGRNIV